MPRRPIEIVHLAHTTFPADPRVKREAFAAAATGCRVAVIALRSPGQRAVERIGPITVLRIAGRKSRRGPVSYLKEYLDFTWRCRRLLARAQFSRVRVVHIHTLPDFLVWAAGPARQRGARVILDLHEIFPEFTAAKYRRIGRIAAPVARALERWARRLADVTLTVNAPIDELLARRPIGRPERRVVIHNSADPDDFGLEREAQPRTRAPGPLELVYHGSLTPLYGLDVAIRGVAAAATRGVPARLTILGDGPERAALEALAARVDARPNVSFEPRLPQAELPARLARVDAGVVPTRLDGMTRYSLSNKLLDYVHLGIPVLAARLPSYHRYLGEDAAWFWTPDDPEDFARAIAEFATAGAPERAARAKRAQQRLAPIVWPRERERLLAVYQELLGRS